MIKTSRRLVAFLVLTTLASSAAVQAGPASHRLTETAALNVLERALKHDHIYAGRISLDCITYGTEEQTDKYFDFVLRENHTANCGGDPETSPVVDRYRVYRASRKIERYAAVEDKWQPYDPALIPKH